MMSPKELELSLELDPDRPESNVVDMSIHYGPEVPDGIDADDPIGLLRDFNNLPPKTRHDTDHPSSSHGLIGVTNVMVGDLGTEVTTESLRADAMVRSSGIDDLMETSGTHVPTRSSGVVNVEGLRVPTSWWDRQASDDDDVEADDDDVEADDDDVEADDDDVEADDDVETDKDDVEADDDDVETDKDDVEADDDEDGDEEIDEEIDD
ncbi:hypothetical protein AALP_AAs63066U000100 [Arabis alpina]|uniref:Uncharacterized protein n=1 Tax=Arabis alpina TaxID=50452 RepID=A0A087G0N8_ARAAL|nr:hypothetical protein AALP_AAs63066U000100 [Arabis alpina]